MNDGSGDCDRTLAQPGALTSEAYLVLVPRARSLFLTFALAVVVAVGFSFTIIGLIAEAAAILALLGLAFRGVTGAIRTR